jgi:hypothetical protein
MKITIEQEIDNQKYIHTIDTPSITADDVLNDFCNIMLSVGFHPKSVEEAILGKAEEYDNRPI